MGESIRTLPGVPLLGSLPLLLRDPFAVFLRSLALGVDINSVDVAFIKFIVLHHPDHIHYVLRDNHRNYIKGGPFWDGARELLGNGLLSSKGGDFWLRQRRMMQPQFRPQRQRVMAESIVETLGRTLDWADVGEDWTELVPLTKTSDVAMQVALRVILGSDLSVVAAKEFHENLGFIFDRMFAGMLGYNMPRWVPIPGRKEFGTRIERVKEYVDLIIQRQRSKGAREDNLLGLLIQATDEVSGESMTDEQLRDEVMTLFVAGFETTAASMSWALLSLTREHHAWETLRAEVDAVLGTRTPTHEDLPSLPYARFVVQEALRLYPPAWIVPRVVVEPDTIGGYAVQPGDLVVPSIFTAHRNPAVWKQPEVFDPGRFGPEHGAERNKAAWVPFGFGPRICIGAELALTELQFAMAMIVQRYDLEARPDAPPPRPHPSMSMRPKDSETVRMRRRRDPPGHPTS